MSSKKKKTTLRDYIIGWDNNHPYDYFWRKKHNIPFGSERHLAMSFIDMKIELLEDVIYHNFLIEIRENNKINKEKLLNPLKREPIMTKEEEDAEFENLNLEDFDTIQ
jgi:hypothetical protein